MVDQVATLDAARVTLLTAGTLTGASVIGGTTTWADIVAAMEDHAHKIGATRDLDFHRRTITFFGELELLIEG